MTGIVFVDIETLSLRRPALGQDPGIWEVAVIACDLNTDTRTVTVEDNWWGYLHVYGQEVAEADPGSLRVNRFYQRHPQYRHPGRVIRLDNVSLADDHGRGDAYHLIPEHADPPPGPDDMVWHQDTAAARIARLCAGRTMIGANPSFDEERLAWLCAKYGHQLVVDYHLSCVRQLTAGWLAGLSDALSGLSDAAGGSGGPPASVFPPLSGRKLAESLPLDRTEDSLHRAWDDCVDNLNIYCHIMRLDVVGLPGDPHSREIPGQGKLFNANGATVVYPEAAWHNAPDRSQAAMFTRAAEDHDTTLAEAVEDLFEIEAGRVLAAAGVTFEDGTDRQLTIRNTAAALRRMDLARMLNPYPIVPSNMRFAPVEPPLDPPLPGHVDDTAQDLTPRFGPTHTGPDNLW